MKSQELFHILQPKLKSVDLVLEASMLDMCVPREVLGCAGLLPDLGLTGWN